jgi:peptidoglycan/LPS O-acetylase OafA/YrhL
LRFTLRSKASASSSYRPDLDGLRAIAVLSVILFHAHIPHFDGGFVGVDVFFVLSGYLITQILQNEIDRGRFSFLKFYERRIRRIFPALFTVALACTAAGIVLFPPQQLRDFARSMLAMTIFSSNVYFTKTSSPLGYFGEQSGVRLLLHTWSLAVEEQFYFGFPILLLLLNRFARRYVRAILFCFLILSLALSIRGVKVAPIGTFYLVRGRAWELLIGCLIALKPVPPLRSYLARTLLGVAGLAGIVFAVFTYNAATLFPGAAAIPPCLGAGLIIYAGEAGDSLLKRVMGVAPLVFLGVLSYSLYLWHWPILAITKYYYPYYFIAPRLTVVPLLLCLLLSFLTFEFIETPFRVRHSAAGKHGNKPLWIGLCASASLALIAFALDASNGFPRRFHAHKVEQMTQNYNRKSEVVDIGACANFMADPRSLADIVSCPLGNSPKKILFMGDSHVIQLYPLLQRMQADGEFGDRSLLFAMSGGCVLATHLNRADPGYHCAQFTALADQRARMDDIDTVVFIFSPFWAFIDGQTCVAEHDACGRLLPHEEAWKIFLADTASRLGALRKAGKHVVIGLPFPLYNVLIPDMEIRNLALYPLHLQAVYPFQLIPPGMISDLRNLAAALGAGLYDPRSTLCPKGVCTFAIDDVSLYSDQSHIATSQLGILHPGLRQAMQNTPQ